MSDIWPPHITETDSAALQALDAAGIGEGDMGQSHDVPEWLLELHEVLEWQAAVAAAEQEGDR